MAAASDDYTETFYSDLAEGSERSADIIVPLLLQRMSVTSVLDVGCGVGSWLSSFVAAGVDDVLGVDSDHVPEHLLRIPADKFARADLADPFDLGRTFDLTISVEVAEHLPEASADGFVASIAGHADLVLFAAAVPGQGGTGHVNERWPSYWAKRFEGHGFVTLDPLRPLIWDRDDVMFWYAQNCLLYARGAALEKLGDVTGWTPRLLDVVHPAMWSRPPDPVGLRSLVRQVPGVMGETVAHYRKRLAARRT
jgi:SAM-dependent methyltransferase